MTLAAPALPNRRFAGGGFDKVGAVVDTDAGSAGNQRGFFNNAGFQNDFGRMFFAGNFTYQGNEVGTGLIIAGKKVPVRKDGVDFHGALFERVFRFGTDFAQVAAAVGEVDDRGQV